MQMWIAGADTGIWIAMMPLGGLFWVVALALVVATFIWFRRAQLNARVFEADTSRQEQAVRVLDERFSRGEIEREDYLKKRRDLFA
jgi:putative membrane protein